MIPKTAHTYGEWKVVKRSNRDKKKEKRVILVQYAGAEETASGPRRVQQVEQRHQKYQQEMQTL